MSIELEYAVKKDIRNNTVVRSADARHRSDIRRMLVLGVLGFGMLLFSAWQHFEMLHAGYRIQDLRQDYEREVSINRRLRLNLETMRTPQRLETQARVLGLRPATLAETVVVERREAPSDVGTVVASAVR